MNRRRMRILLPWVVPVFFLSIHLSAQEGTMSEKDPFGTAEGLVTELYKSVTFEAGTTPDWDRVRSMFIDEAVIVLRTKRDATTVFSVEGFVDDFKKFIDRAHAEKTGFSEKIIRMKPMVFRDIAHILVLYEASIPGSGKAPQQGVDSFQLIRKGDRWWIASVTNEIPTAEDPIPAELKE